MLKCYSFIFTIVFSLTGYPSAVKAASCENYSKQSAMTSCAIREYKEASKALKKIYQNKTLTLSASRRNSIREKQKKWLKHAKYDCRIEANEGTENRSIRSMVFNLCLTDKISRRIPRLKRLNY